MNWAGGGSGNSLIWDTTTPAFARNDGRERRQKGRPRGRDFNSGTPKFESEELSNRTQRLVIVILQVLISLTVVILYRWEDQDTGVWKILKWIWKI
jgi:NADH:ubiquinone oxidoreductase subunit 3 (subunit A)